MICCRSRPTASEPDPHCATQSIQNAVPGSHGGRKQPPPTSASGCQRQFRITSGLPVTLPELRLHLAMPSTCRLPENTYRVSESSVFRCLLEDNKTSSRSRRSLCPQHQNFLTAEVPYVLFLSATCSCSFAFRELHTNQQAWLHCGQTYESVWRTHGVGFRPICGG